MSFLAQRTLLRAPRALAYAPRASFATSQYMSKSATEAAKDTLKSADRAVSDKLVDGIEAGRKFSSSL